MDSVGIGGVEITPIYGVKGYEAAYIDFLSPKWMEMLHYTVDQKQAARYRSRYEHWVQDGPLAVLRSRRNLPLAGCLSERTLWMEDNR